MKLLSSLSKIDSDNDKCDKSRLRVEIIVDNNDRFHK